MGTSIFECPTLGEKIMWGLHFCSTERRLGTINGKMGDEKKVSFKDKLS